MNLMTIEERLDIVKKAYYGEGIQERVLYVAEPLGDRGGLLGILVVMSIE